MRLPSKLLLFSFALLGSTNSVTAQQVQGGTAHDLADTKRLLSETERQMLARAMGTTTVKGIGGKLENSPLLGKRCTFRVRSLYAERTPLRELVRVRPSYYFEDDWGNITSVFSVPSKVKGSTVKYDILVGHIPTRLTAHLDPSLYSEKETSQPKSKRTGLRRLADATHMIYVHIPETILLERFPMRPQVLIVEPKRVHFEFYRGESPRMIPRLHIEAELVSMEGTVPNTGALKRSAFDWPNTKKGMKESHVQMISKVGLASLKDHRLYGSPLLQRTCHFKITPEHFKISQNGRQVLYGVVQGQYPNRIGIVFPADYSLQDQLPRKAECIAFVSDVKIEKRYSGYDSDPKNWRLYVECRVVSSDALGVSSHNVSTPPP